MIFRFHPVAKGEVATTLKGFSGAFVKNSVILNRVLTVEYVPLPKEYQVVNLDCGIRLPGAPRVSR